LEKIRNGTRGSRWRRSIQMNVAINTAAMAKPASVRPEVQPQLSALISVKTSAIVPSVIATAPSTSYPPFETRSERLSGTILGASASTTAPIGTLTKKTQRQLSSSTITPPRSSPMAPPAPAMAPHTASARFRSGPSAKVVRMIDSAAGETIAPPSPWRPRATSSMPSDCESPQMREAPEKRAIPAMKSRRRPSRSAARPPSSRKPPKISV
jgi:hypothetical protein